MTNRYLTDLADILRAAGLKVVEVPGWKTRGRPHSSGDYDPQGNGWHHTGAKDSNPLSLTDDAEYARWLAEIGRSDLAAPLCQVSVGRDGTCYVCAAGRGNHAGKARAFAGLPAGDGNAMYLGWECQNSGSEGWSPEQYAAMVIGGAATCAAYGWDPARNPGHKEISTTGKWDPGLLDMDRFRADIKTAMNPRKDVLDMTPDELRQIIREEIGRNRINVKNAKGEMESINDDTAFRRIFTKLDQIAKDTRPPNLTERVNRAATSGRRNLK